MLKDPIFEEKDLKKLLNLFKIEKILQQTIQGIHGSSILTIESYQNLLMDELKKLGKNDKSELLYKAKKDGLS